MASEDLLTRRGSHIGSRLSSILGELQKKQAIDNPPSPDRPSPRRRSITSEIVVAVMGVTGSGKSSFIRRVSEIDEVVVGSGLQSGKNTHNAEEPFEKMHKLTSRSDPESVLFQIRE